MLLKWQRVSYVSYTNIGSIIIHQPLAALGMVAILLAIIILVYWQFAFLLLGIMNIFRGRPQTVRAVLRSTVTSLTGTSPSTFLFFIGYFIVILPFWKFHLYNTITQQGQNSSLHCQLSHGKPVDDARLGVLLLAGWLPWNSPN